MSKIQDALNLAKKIERRASKKAESGDVTEELREQAAPPEEPKPRLLKSKPVEVELSETLLASNRIINSNFPEGSLRAYKMLRTRVSRYMRSSNLTSIAITSPFDGAGKTTTAINLAIAMAASGQNDVTLLDFDLQNPAIGGLLGLPEDGTDLGALLAGTLSTDLVPYSIGVDRLTVFSANEPRRNSAEIVSSKRAADLLGAIAGAGVNPITIVDIPPLLEADDALAIAPLIDCFVLVVAEGETEATDVSRAVRLLNDCNICAIVLNKSSTHQER